MQPTEKTTYHHGDLRRTLLNVSVDMIDRKGIEALNLRELAILAGVSSGAPYHHFASKDALLAGIATQGFNELTETMSKQVPVLLERVNKSAAALQTMTEELAHTGRSVRSAVQESRPDIEQFTRQTLSETGALVTELRQLTGTMQRVARQLEQEPSSLVLGKKSQQRGPGE